ncbi:hypothetical protein [Arthrobacter koreensis]|uniref:hypothetical protein n=1 Tax=Arthrobacter koreensis TaxID=199136 RepID=UPI0038266E2D
MTEQPEINTGPEHQEPPAGKAKLSAEDVEARFAARRAKNRERKAGRTPEMRAKLVRRGAAAALGLGVVGLALVAGESARLHAVEVAANESRIFSLHDALAALSPEKGGEGPAELALALSAAQKRSDELAAAQQQFAVISHDGNDDPETGDGRPRSAVLKSLDHRKTLAPFFAPQALRLSDDQAYTFRTEDLLDPGAIDPRQPWYTRYEAVAGGGSAQKAADPAGYVWTTASVAPSGTPGVMAVVWTNADSRTGELLAWATAQYYAESDTFGNLSVHKTTRGESQQLQVGTTGTTQGANA